MLVQLLLPSPQRRVRTSFLRHPCSLCKGCSPDFSTTRLQYPLGPDPADSAPLLHIRYCISIFGHHLRTGMSVAAAPFQAAGDSYLLPA